MRSENTPAAESHRQAGIAKLFEIKMANFKMDGNMHPEIAAQFAVEAVLHMIRGQPQFAEQLISEEIEDDIKAGQSGGACKFYAA